MKLSPKCHTSGTTLVEILVATLLLASFFASLFEANAVCLRFIAASKQSVGAIEAVQARAEVFRNLAFSDLTTTSYVQNRSGNPAANTSDFAKSATEVVKISAYPTANGVTQMTRTTGRHGQSRFYRHQFLGVYAGQSGHFADMDRSARWPTTNRANIAHYFQRHKEMKLTHHSHQSGFTLAEILTAMAIAVVIFAAIITASLAMQKSFNAVDHYFATHIQQVRIIDYLNRDVKRALICTTSANQQTVTLTIPKYIIQSGDAEAVSNPSLVGAMRNPTISTTTSGVQVNYGTTTSTVVYSINGASILRTEDGRCHNHCLQHRSINPNYDRCGSCQHGICNYGGHVSADFYQRERRRRTHWDNRLFSRLSPK